MVFQSYALYPHMSVHDNLAYGLKVRGRDRSTVARRVADVTAALGLDGLLDRRPAQLSGGQRQRVALGRAMVRQPKAFLLDEPLSNLDPQLRAQARAEIRRLHGRLGTTVVYVTHDQEEAMTLGGRVAVMRDGRIEQVAPPLEIYAAPANTFVAQFIGSPPMNLPPAAALGIEAPHGALAGIRPQDIIVSSHAPRPLATTLPAIIDLVEPRGHDHVVHLRLTEPPGLSFVATMAGSVAPRPGDEVAVTFPPERVHLFDGATGRRL
jgi:ABC-type sugar transport system ATPase subunit